MFRCMNKSVATSCRPVERHLDTLAKHHLLTLRGFTAGFAAAAPSLPRPESAPSDGAFLAAAALDPDLGPTPTALTTPVTPTLAGGTSPAKEAAAAVAVENAAFSSVSSSSPVLDAAAAAAAALFALGVLQRLVPPPRSLRERFWGGAIGLRSVERRPAAAPAASARPSSNTGSGLASWRKREIGGGV